MANDKAALIVGAGDSTGGAIARRFAREGFFELDLRPWIEKW